MPLIPNALYEKIRFQEPQITLTCPAVGRMWLISLCALMAIVQSALTDAFSSLFLALVSVFTALMTEFLILDKNSRTALFKDGSTVASALVFSLLLPNRLSPVYAAIGAIFAVAVIKHSFGGLGANWLNPAAGAWLFVRLSWPASFHRALEGSTLSLDDFITQSGFPSTDFAVFLNNKVFSLFGTKLPDFYADLFASSAPGIIADRGIMALLLGSIIIMAFQAGRPMVPLFWISVFAIFTRMTGAFHYGEGWWKGDIIFALCTGGTIAAAFILAAEPVTSAKSSWGILGSAIAGGFFAWLFRYHGDEPYGAVFSILVVNALLPVIRNIETSRLYVKRKAP